jgi:hypothetical protein
MINPPKLESIRLPTKEDLFNNGYKPYGRYDKLIILYLQQKIETVESETFDEPYVS